VSILRVQNLTKVYPGTVALDNVSMKFESGKINAVIGKNGSGKSTLIKAIGGVIKQTSGQIFIDDKELALDNPIEGYAHGIATVFQELSLIPSLSIAENIFMGNLPVKKGFVDWKTVYKKTEELLTNMDIHIPPQTLVSSLSMWQRQMIEIVKAMSHNPKILLLDEPTSALARSEVELLFQLIRRVKERDVIVIYITHRLHELWQIADCCLVLRDGKYVGTVSMQNATHKEIVDMMFGDVEIRKRPTDIVGSDEIVLSVRKLTREGKFKNISFDLRKGEILGIAGMLGSGRTELLMSIFGADPFDSGQIFVNGKVVKKHSIRTMKSIGIAMTQEDRGHKGLVQIRPVSENLCFASLGKLSKKGFMDSKAETQAVDKQIDELDIKVSSAKVRVSSLSGGNQQKVVVGNWLNTEPRIIMFDEPSRGIDVNAKQQIFQIIWEQSRRGIASIMVSSELEELLEVCNRILIMRYGEIVEEVSADGMTVEELYVKCMGGN
jgi:ribose transport system ATP-binding protein